MKSVNFSDLAGHLLGVVEQLPDERKGTNLSYKMKDFALKAFSSFFSQAPSFRAHHKTLKPTLAKNNAKSFFAIGKVPCDNQMRAMLDLIEPKTLYPVYDHLYQALSDQGILQTYRGVHDSTLLALDGTWLSSSKKIQCTCCSTLEHANGEITYYHSALTPVIVAPGKSDVIALRPELITPQDGHTKQDCEIAASKRWLEENTPRYLKGVVTLLGDDLYAHQPFCRRALMYGFHFLLVCKPESHVTLYKWVNLLRPGPDLRTLQVRVKSGGQFLTYTYRWANNVPLAEGADALKVNGCEVTVRNAEKKSLYHNAWITDWPITEQNVAETVASGRARWKIEKENNNTLKTQGYNLEHNFGHGKKHLSSLLAAMNILAFLYHTVLSLTDQNYRLVRATLPSGQTFFQDLRALTRYLPFASWQELLQLMMRGLEIGPYAKPI